MFDYASQEVQNYFPILVFFIVSLALSLFIISLPFFLAKREITKAKSSPYECGFEPFSNARVTFDVRFYLVAILFIVFDLEVMFLLPWSVTLKQIGWEGFWSMMIFLFVLVVGFVYEWRKGALEWK
jgi:NADH-quinone oxidoreductase subunit A